MAVQPSTDLILPLLPLRELLVFPHTVVPLFVGREKSIRALEEAMSGNREIFLSAQKKSKTNDPNPEDIFSFGTIAQILQLLRLPDGTVKILVEGRKRAQIKSYKDTNELFLVEVEEIQEERGQKVESEALVRAVKSAFDTYVKLNKKVPPEMVFSISNIEEESRLADTLVVQLSNLKLDDKQRILETTNPTRRLEEIFGIIQSEIEILKVEKKIRARVKRQMEKTQKEYYLNEQMNAIQKELGNVDDIRTEIADIEAKMKNKLFPQETEEKLKKEIKKLRVMSPMSAEATVVRNYIDTLLSLPWGEARDLICDPQFAQMVLDEDHYGLDKVKERILEYLAVSSLSEKMRGPILCLVGPPGVGKTSLAKSIARSTGRQFARLSLGGVRDEAEIRGHRRTYIGAMPGKIISAVKKAGSNNPLILLDEIDKMSSDFRGDPSSAMLEVLDPEQNATFVDHYLDVDYDLSKIMFLATANSLHSIPRPLLDRMEVVTLGGYTEIEKQNIASNYLVPKAAKNSGMENVEVAFEDEAILELIRHDTREAGVRNLEREIARVCRKQAKKLITERVKTTAKDSTKVQAKDVEQEKLANHRKIVLKELPKQLITSNDVREFLGPRTFKYGELNAENEVGVCQGMAYTEVGGDLLLVEVSTMYGKGNLKVTGKLGDVMQESCQAAFSYIRSRADFLGLENNFHEKIDVHVHFPEGAIPKDGPSAGITMATALASALTLRPINRMIAMTGEITLRGRVLPIGGLKEKMLAAHRGGVRKIIIPKENEKDLHDIPEVIRKDLEVVAAAHMDTVLYHALVWQDSDTLRDKLYAKEESLNNLTQKTPQAKKPAIKPTITH